MCGAPDQDSLPALEVSPNEAIIHGLVTSSGEPVPGAYVRLLDSTGEFTAEVQTSATGYFRFYAADGQWTSAPCGGAPAPQKPQSKPSEERPSRRRSTSEWLSPDPPPRLIVSGVP